eukprot:SAG31_NODE_1545_length_7942_cov_6.001020_6_plen_165_part_00
MQESTVKELQTQTSQTITQCVDHGIHSLQIASEHLQRPSIAANMCQCIQDRDSLSCLDHRFLFNRLTGERDSATEKIQELQKQIHDMVCLTSSLALDAPDVIVQVTTECGSVSITTGSATRVTDQTVGGSSQAEGCNCFPHLPHPSGPAIRPGCKCRFCLMKAL